LLAVSVPVEQKTNVQGLSDSMMNLSGAFGGAFAGTIVSLHLFTGLNMAALVPVAAILVLSVLVRNHRAKVAKTSVHEDLPAHE
jgi:Flp pilus assembly protein TadB